MFSFFQSKNSKRKVLEVQAQLVKIENHIQSIHVGSGDHIQAGGDITAGKGIHGQGGTVINKWVH